MSANKKKNNKVPSLYSQTHYEYPKKPVCSQVLEWWSITQINHSEFQEITKLQNLLEIKTIIMMLRGYYNNYDAANL